MSSTTKQYTPTTTARPTWREREMQKERLQREAVSRAAEEAQMKKFAKTEENFPSTMKVAQRMTVPDVPAGKFAALAAKWNVDEQLLRSAKNDRERKIIHDTVMFIRSGGAPRDDYEEDYDDISTVVEEESLDEKFPPHGKRGTYTAPDSEGWRYVTKKMKKQPRELTEAELHQKYRETFFGEDGEEDADHNGDLTDRNQRREFY